MDARARGFRKRAREENRGRTGLGRRYSVGLSLISRDVVSLIDGAQAK